MWMWWQRRPKQESKAFSSKGEGTSISLNYDRNEEGRHCKIDQRWRFRVRDSQGCCHGFSNDSKHAYFPRFPFLILTFCTSIHFFEAYDLIFFNPCLCTMNLVKIWYNGCFILDFPPMFRALFYCFRFHG